MRLKIIFGKFIRRPLKRIGKTVMNILIFDMASAVYGYAKGWFREPRTKPLKEKEEEIGNDLDWQGTKERRW